MKQWGRLLSDPVFADWAARPRIRCLQHFAISGMNMKPIFRADVRQANVASLSVTKSPINVLDAQSVPSIVRPMPFPLHHIKNTSSTNRNASSATSAGCNARKKLSRSDKSHKFLHTRSQQFAASFDRFGNAHPGFAQSRCPTYACALPFTGFQFDCACDDRNLDPGGKGVRMIPDTTFPINDCRSNAPSPVMIQSDPPTRNVIRLPSLPYSMPETRVDFRMPPRPRPKPPAAPAPVRS